MELLEQHIRTVLKLLVLKKYLTISYQKLFLYLLLKIAFITLMLKKSVGVGLSYGVGIGTTISYIGAGNTTKT